MTESQLINSIILASVLNIGIVVLTAILLMARARTKLSPAKSGPNPEQS